ncbi:MAG: hypothetical protein VW547_00705 [Alphaproteobacteria bacterium]
MLFLVWVAGRDVHAILLHVKVGLARHYRIAFLEKPILRLAAEVPH